VTLSILALEKDLFFSVKIRDTLQHHDMDATIVRTLPTFEQHLIGEQKPALIIVNTASKNIDWEAAIRTAHEKGIPVLAFGSHMDLAAREKALQAGARRVVANSKFASDMAGLIKRTLNGKTGSTAATEDEADESM
jgi:ABC-type sugar transport system substrate-binding protein